MNEKAEALSVRRIERWHARLEELVLADWVPLEAFLLECEPDFRTASGALESPLRAEDDDPGPSAEALAGRRVKEGETWGRTWEVRWFRLLGRVPSGWAGDEVVAQVDLGGEGLVLLPTGACLQGIANRSVFSEDFRRDLVRLHARCDGGEAVELFVEAVASELFGVRRESDPPVDDPERHGRYEAQVRRLRLVRFHGGLWDLMLDLRVLLGLVRRLPAKSVRRARLLRAASEAADRFAGDPARAPAAREVVESELQRPAEPSAPIALAVGHAHIDTAWLWPVDEGARKCARTFASQLRLLDRYPEYVFGASQAQHYAFIKERHGELYTRLRRAVASGRWEIQGGMWVEADCNLIDGESMVRQILHGKNFFRDEFGVEVENLWLPDVFGYSAALPQILRRCGIDSLVTQKMSWNQFNDFPHTTFRWRGIDGSEVLAHFPPENNYNSPLDPESLIAGMENFREKGFLDEFLSLFGVGDGGGGPKEEQIECGLRLRDLEGCPRVRFGPARDFLARLRAQKERLAVWEGELYLELHRGTLTSQAEVKRGNRKLEQALRAVEMIWSALPLVRYPAGELERLWRILLLNQFHDILPGSSIARTYERTRAEHREALAACDGLLERAGAELFSPETSAVVLFQPHSAPFDGAIPLPGDWAGHAVLDEDGTALPAQDEGATHLVRAALEPLGFRTLRKGPPAAPKAMPPDGRTPQAGSPVLENDLVRYELGPDGTLRRAFDKVAAREILSAGARGNVFTLYEDRPNDWDAWDVDLFYEGSIVEEARLLSMDPLESGPVRQRVCCAFAIGDSEIRQTITLEPGTRQLDFTTEVLWNERHRMLRVAFSVAVRAAEASYEIQYGFLRRPTHRNTSWDLARFECAGHRYVDLSDGDYGVALLNDCKYGHKVHGNVIDLNLLRSPTNPDPDADRGPHRFVYALYPHPGDLPASDVRQRAAVLNRPPLVFAGRSAAARDASARRYPVLLEGDGLTLAVVKKAEKSEDRILRIVETRGRVSTGRIVFRSAKGTLRETDLLEWRDGGEPRSCASPIEITLRPFEIRTYRWSDG